MKFPRKSFFSRDPPVCRTASTAWFGAFVGRLLVGIGILAFSACGGSAPERVELSLEELDRAHQCYRCQEPCFRRMSVWKSPKELYEKCLAECGERHNTDKLLCGIAHPETFRGWEDEPLGASGR